VYLIDLFLLFLSLRYVLPLLLQYDSTAEENEANAHGVGASVQIVKNTHAILATQALSRLCCPSDEEDFIQYNEAANDALTALLTHKLAAMLKKQTCKDLLSNLNANLESPEVNTFHTMVCYLNN
jgi:DnaJ homolog subfamily C member 13